MNDQPATLKIRPLPSPNYGDRRAPFASGPRYIMLHYTSTICIADSRFLLTTTDRPTPVSAHYLIDEDGTIEGLVDETKRAWHAGNGDWQGITDMNSASVGIELQNPGHGYGLRPFPDVQIDALVALCRDIMRRWSIPVENIIGHSDYAPGRKIDPGPLFPWDRLRAALSG